MNEDKKVEQSSTAGAAKGGNTCVCGDVSSTGTVHRTDGPCYADLTILPPLTAPAPLTDELPREEYLLSDADMDAMHDAIDSTFHARTTLSAAPAPQQSELTDDRIRDIAISHAYDVIGDGKDPLTFKFGEATIIGFARAIEAEVAKA